MFSKTALLLALCVSLVTCSDESRPPDDEFVVKLSKGQCIAELADQVKDYVAGRMQRAQIVAFWDCLSSTMLEFQRLTSAEDGDKYMPKGLKRFLHEFAATPELSDPLIDAIMELKRVLLSGSNQHLTSSELTTLQSLLGELKEITLDLQPHVKLIFAKPLPVASDAEVEQAGQALARAAERFGEWLARFQQPYTVNQMEKLFNSMADWMDQDSGSRDTIRNLANFAPALGAAKRLFVSGGSSQIEGASWLPLAKTLGQAGRIYLDFRHAFKDDLNSGLIRTLLPEAVNVVAQLLESAIQRRGGGLPFSEWLELLQKVEASKVLSKEFSVKSLKPALEWILTRGFGDGTVVNELNLTHVQRIRYHYLVWRRTLDRVNGQAVPQFPEWAEYEAVLKRTPPLNWDSEGRLEISRTGPTTWTQPNRRRMVWPFAILHWLKMAYVGDAATLTEIQMTDATAEVLPLLQNFGWLTDSKLTIGKRLVREADLFIHPSNGDSLLDLPEATEYLAVVASNFRVAQVWLNEAEPLCPELEAQCVRKIALRPQSRVFEPLPELRATILLQPAENFFKYMKAAEETILGQAVVGPVGSADILQVMQLLQYVEIFLNFYDVDRSQTINLIESLAAYPKYGPTLARLLSSGTPNPNDILAIYTFLMKYGNTPFSYNDGGLRWVNWKLKRDHWAFEADRATLLGILNSLSKL